MRRRAWAAIRQRVLREHRFTYAQLLHYLDTNWEGPEGERARLFLQNVDRYGKGGSDADDLAVRLSQIFTREVKAQRTPVHGFQMVPGLFSWANTLTMGATLGATPNGRRRRGAHLPRRKPQPRLPQGRRRHRHERGPSPPCSRATATPRPCRSSSSPP